MDGLCLPLQMTPAASTLSQDKPPSLWGHTASLASLPLHSKSEAMKGSRVKLLAWNVWDVPDVRFVGDLCFPKKDISVAAWAPWKPSCLQITSASSWPQPSSQTGCPPTYTSPSCRSAPPTRTTGIVSSSSSGGLATENSVNISDMQLP